jgi:hypothetical protein
MDSTISIFLGPPEHGWLTVDFYYQDFHLEFDASGVLNDPIEELYHVITKLENNEYRQVIWWLEPGAYLFDFKKSGQHTTLTITETKYLHNQDAEKKTLIEINDKDNKITEPFRNALKQFFAKKYEQNHWPHNLDKNKIENL